MGRCYKQYNRREALWLLCYSRQFVQIASLVPIFIPYAVWFAKTFLAGIL